MQGPTQVTGLTVTPASATQLNLAWTANPTTENIDHYNVYRGTTAGFTVVPGTTPPTAQPTTNSFNDTGLTTGTAYYYRVAAVDTGGQIGAISGESSSTPGATRYSILLNGTSQHADAGTNASLGVGETPGSESFLFYMGKPYNGQRNPTFNGRRNYETWPNRFLCPISRQQWSVRM